MSFNTTRNELTYDWTVEGFETRREPNGEHISSPTFWADPGSGFEHIKWKLCFYPKGHVNGKDHVSLFLDLVDPQNVTLQIKYKLILLKVFREVVRNDTFSIAIPDSHSWGVHRFVKLADISNKRSEVLTDGGLTLRCEIVYQLTDRRLRPVKVQPEFEQKGFDSEPEERDNGSSEDVVLKAEGREIKAHRHVLGLNSTVFKVMFEKNESMKVVNVTGVPFDVVQLLMRFIYTGKVAPEKVTPDLLKVATKYCLKNLKADCEKELGSRVTVDNAVATLTKADKSKNSRLKERALELISRNVQEVKKTPGREEGEKHSFHLLFEALSRFADRLAPSPLNPSTS